ncbi:MAG TPA: hypothetical protein VF629_09310 [Hymenobacter sp.]|jgi:hypothetical protein|uniref:hypothetical protein n=1 Tax=Hymenobacter sp. TaxID=1898978 RepID=UPI002ED97A88
MHVKQVMHTRSRYTIGYLTGGIYTPKSGKSYNYRYRVKGQEYEATDNREKNMNTENGSRFLVEYDTLDPGVSTGHFAAAISDGMPDSPPNGWKTPPVPIPKIPSE